MWCGKEANEKRKRRSYPIGRCAAVYVSLTLNMKGFMKIDSFLSVDCNGTEKTY